MGIVIAIVVIAVLALVFLITVNARRDRATALHGVGRETRRRDRSRADVDSAAPEGTTLTGREIERAAVLDRAGLYEVEPVRVAPPARRGPLEPDALGVTRRQFVNSSIVGMFSLGLAGFGASTIAFLWPNLSGGFGSKIRAGKVEDVLSQIRDTKEPVYVPEGRFYLARYPADALSKARANYSGGVLAGMEAGVVALYQKCVHLGCRVPWCKSAQWFECPCHGSQYNAVGEKRGGPAPRGLDRFSVSVSGGTIVVDTGQLSVGPAIGVNTTGQEAEGPHCT